MSKVQGPKSGGAEEHRAMVFLSPLRGLEVLIDTHGCAMGYPLTLLRSYFHF